MYLLLLTWSSFLSLPAIAIDKLESVARSEGAEVTYYRFPLNHIAYYPEQHIQSKPQLEHKYGLVNVGIHSASKSSPIVMGDILYVGSDSGYLYALDKSTFKVLWKFRIRPQGEYGIHATAAVQNDRVFIGGYDGYLYTLDRFTGELLDQRKLGGSIGASPVIWHNRLYVGVETPDPDGYLDCVDLETYNRCFDTYWMGDHTHSTPTIDDDTQTVFIGSNNEWFYAFNAMTGELKWKYETGGEIKSTAAIAGDLVLVTSWDTNLYAFDKRSGEVVWTFAAIQRSMSSPAIDIDAQRVYFGSHDSYLYCVDLKTGQLIWKYLTGEKITSSPAIATADPDNRKVVVVGSADGNIYWLDAANGSTIYTFATQDRVTSVPLIADGRVYVSGDDGYLYAFR
jgi:outer membrane protein assembly factor BamB